MNKARRFCGSACKQAAYHSRNAKAEKVAPGSYTHAAETWPLEHIETIGKIRTVDRRIVPDAIYPGMYRIRLSDGSLTDMVNLTRAKDAVRDCSQDQR